MVAARRPEQQETLRSLVNVGYYGRWVAFSSWLQSVLVPIPKELGNLDLEKAQPITLLEVLPKAYWGVVSRRLATTWEAAKLLQPHQFGFLKWRTVLSPLVLATLLAKQ